MGRNQESIICIDTHVALWLYDKLMFKFSSKCKKLLATKSICASPMVLIELQYLFEIGKLIVAPNVILQCLIEDIDLKISDTPFVLVAQYANQNTWTRDSFDRIIVSDAQAQNAPLASADKIILKNYKKALI